MLKKMLVLSGCVLLTSCGSINSPTTGSGSVSYGDAKAVETINTDFGSTDLNMVVQKMSTSLIASNKINSCKTYTVSKVRNKTDQYIDTETITQGIVDKLSNSDAVKSTYVLSEQELVSQVDELNRQNNTGLYGSKAKKGKMKGAECRIDGFITNITKDNGSVKNVFYVFNMKLINVEEGTQLWTAEKQISKNVK